jgi:hypothetical protein
MANRYGEAALMAVQQVPADAITPAERWKISIEKLYPTSRSARNKACPREAFFGLCEEGLVIGIPAGRYTRSQVDKLYAVRAVALLTEGKQHWSTTALWQAVTNGDETTHNSQMDIVLALWNNDLIVGKH